MAELRLEAVTLRSPAGRVVLDGLDWLVGAGARVRVAAERGAGGSALLRVCAGIASPDAGRVLIDGVPHDPRRSFHPLLRRGGLAWIPEDGGHLANLSLLENVALPLRFVRGLARRAAESDALGALARVGLADHAGVRPHALSRRERQLGALARCALMRCELWLLDRPLEDLDGTGLAVARELLGEALASPGATLVVVGDGPQYERLPASVVRLERGRVKEEHAIRA